MARMRSLKPEFWLDRKLARTLSRDARMLYLGLWNQADEHGRANGDARVVKGQIFPFDDDLTDAVIETLLKELESAGVVQQYEHDGDPFLYLPKLAKHQRLEPHKVPSRFPEPPELDPDQQVLPLPDLGANPSERDPGGTQTSPREIHAKHVAGSREHVAGGRGAGEDGADAPRTPRASRVPDPFPVDDDLRTGARQLGYTDQQIDSVTAEFVDYWRGVPGAKGTKLDWPATWRNWLREEARRRRIRPPGNNGSAGGDRPSWEL